MTIAAVLEGDGAQLGWVGPHQAVLVRDGVIVHRTAPHSVGCQLISQGLCEAQVRANAVAHIPSRRIDAERPAEAKPEFASWSLRTGDRLLLLSSHLLRAVSDDVVDGFDHGSIDDVAERLMNKALETADYGELAVIAVRVR